MGRYPVCGRIPLKLIDCILCSEILDLRLCEVVSILPYPRHKGTSYLLSSNALPKPREALAITFIFKHQSLSTFYLPRHIRSEEVPLARLTRRELPPLTKKKYLSKHQKRIKQRAIISEIAIKINFEGRKWQNSTRVRKGLTWHI